jgi:hypothetical protein
VPTTPLSRAPPTVFSTANLSQRSDAILEEGHLPMSMLYQRMDGGSMRRTGGAASSLLLALLACVAATLLHHVHNAEFLDQYPNMPAGLSPTGVYAAWGVATAIGLAGYGFLRRGYRTAGVVLLIAYGCYGLDGLAHYALAPASAHSLTMNLTIWLEAVTAAALLVIVFQRNERKGV